MLFCDLQIFEEKSLVLSELRLALSRPIAPPWKGKISV